MSHVAVGIAWLSGAALVAFGVQGCADGSLVHSIAILAGFAAMSAKAVVIRSTGEK